MILSRAQYARWFGADPIAGGVSDESAGMRPRVNQYPYWPMVVAGVLTYAITRVLDRTLFKETR